MFWVENFSPNFFSELRQCPWKIFPQDFFEFSEVCSSHTFHVHLDQIFPATDVFSIRLTIKHNLFENLFITAKISCKVTSSSGLYLKSTNEFITESREKNNLHYISLFQTLTIQTFFQTVGFAFQSVPGPNNVVPLTVHFVSVGFLWISPFLLLNPRCCFVETKFNWPIISYYFYLCNDLLNK